MWCMETYTSYLLSDMNVTKLGKKLVAERKKGKLKFKSSAFPYHCMAVQMLSLDLCPCPAAMLTLSFIFTTVQNYLSMQFKL